MTDSFDRLHNGDCVTGMKALPDGCVDLAFADPPYNIGYEYDAYNDRRSADEYLDWCGTWTDEVIRVLKPDGAFWLAIGDEYAAELKVMLTRQRAEPLHLRSWVVWYYTFGVNCTAKFSRSHAHLLYLVKDPKRFTFNADDPAVRVPSARQLVYADKRANPAGRLPDDTWMMPPVEGETSNPVPLSLGRGVRGEGTDHGSPASCTASSAVHGGTQATNGHPEHPITPFPSPQGEGGPTSPPLTHDGWFLRPQDVPGGFPASGDVWYFPRVAGTFKERSGWHGCQMPERLLARIVRCCSNPGEVVLDPFAGSGTTLAVAKKLGRRWLGYDMSAEYAARAQSRLDAIKTGDPLDGAEDPLTSAPGTAKGRRLKRQRTD